MRNSTGLSSWAPLRLAAPLLIALAAAATSAQPADFSGKWVLGLDSGRNTNYGILEIAGRGDDSRIFIDGGPVNLLRLDGDRIAFDFDWTDGGDRLHVTELNGERVGGRLTGDMVEAGETTGTWFAEPWAAHEDAGADPNPVDLSGVWLSLSRGTHKDAFDLTPEGKAVNDAYSPMLDDPHLRCVSGGVIRMEDGPFAYEVIQRDDHILILYEYFHEVRRIWTDGRNFPEDIENAYLSLGYSIGHWEGSMLVVETRGMKPTVWDAAGMPVSPAGVITERKYLDEEGLLHTDYTLQDPANYNRPIYRHAYRERPADAELRDASCDPHSFYRGLQLEDRLEGYWQRTGSRL